MDNRVKNHVVNFSGGRTSAYMVWLIEQLKESNGWEVEYLYCDTGCEHPNTYKFIRQVVDNFGIKLTCLRTKVNYEFGKGVTYDVVSLGDCKPDLKPMRDVMKKHGTPTVAAPLCSDRMKSIPADKYCDDKYGKNNYYRWLGIRVDEQRRIKTTEQQLDFFLKEKKIPARQRMIKYLANISDFTKSDILEWWGNQSFDLDLEEHLGNCVFCIKKGANKIALAAKDEPLMAREFIALVDSDETMTRPTRGMPNNVMYRDHMSLESIIKSYEDISREELAENVNRFASKDSGSCSESCEAGFDFSEHK